MKIKQIYLTFFLLFIFNFFATSSFSQKEEIDKDDLIYATLFDWVGKRINEPPPMC